MTTAMTPGSKRPQTTKCRNYRQPPMWTPTIPDLRYSTQVLSDSSTGNFDVDAFMEHVHFHLHVLVKPQNPRRVYESTRFRNRTHWWEKNCQSKGRFLSSVDDENCKDDAEMKLLKAFTLVVLIAGVLLCVAGLYWENKLTNLGIPIALLGIALSVAIPVKKRSEGEKHAQHRQ